MFDVEKASTLYMSLLATNNIQQQHVPLSIGKSISTYVLRCLRTATVETLLDVFSVEGKNSFILLNNQALPFPFTRYTGKEDIESFVEELGNKAQRPARLTAPLEKGELYVLNKAGEVTLVKSFRLRSYIVTNHFLKIDDEIIVDLYLSKRQAMIMIDKGLMVAPVSEALSWTYYKDGSKIVREDIDAHIYEHELCDDDKYIVVGRRLANLSFTANDEEENTTDTIYAVMEGIPLYEAEKKIGDIFVPVDSIRFNVVSQECVQLEFPREASLYNLLLEGLPWASESDTKKICTYLKQLVNCRWINIKRMGRRTALHFSLYSFQQSLEVLQKKGLKSLSLSNCTLDGRKHIRELISAFQSFIALINLVLSVPHILNITEEDGRLVLIIQGKEKIVSIFNRILAHYIYSLTFISLDGESFAISSSELSTFIQEHDLFLSAYTTDVQSKEIVCFDAEIAISSSKDLISFFQTLLSHRVAYIKIERERLIQWKEWPNVGEFRDRNLDLSIFELIKGMCKELKIENFDVHSSLFTPQFKRSLYINKLLQK